MIPPGARLRQPTPESGFNLIAMSILLTIASILLVSVLPGKGTGDYYQKTVGNIQKLDKIEEAMKAFMVANQRRPCPADGQYSINSANFGIEAATAGSCTGGTPASDFLGASGTVTGNTTINSNVVTSVSSTTGLTVGMSVTGTNIPTTTASIASIDSSTQITLTVPALATATGSTLTIANPLVGGVIPTKTLGLPDEYALDEFGHRFTYVVDSRATDPTACNVMMQYNKHNAIASGVTIESSTGGTVLDHSLYAYISHGPDGHGAFPAQGSTVANRINTGSTDADKLTNAGVNSSFAYSTATFTNIKVRKEPTTTFNDSVYYADSLKNTCCMGPYCNMGFFTTVGAFTAGYLVTSGDLNGDGISDLIILDANVGGSGYIYVLFGTRTGYANPQKLALNGTNGFYLRAPVSTGQFGRSIALGDVNGDGIADLVFTGSSGVFILFGKRSGWSSSYIANTGPGNLFDGTQGFFLSGESGYTLDHVRIGDVNGDGTTDLILGASGADGAAGASSAAGSVYVVYGGSGPKSGGAWPATQSLTAAWLSNGGSAASPAVNGFRLDGVTAGDNVGSSVASGDVNGDGVADMVIGASGTTPYGSYFKGAVYVVYGGHGPKRGGNWITNQSLTVSPTTSAFIDGFNGYRIDGSYNGSTGDGLGSNVTTGDINGDGIADLVIGAGTARYYSYSGSIYVVFGGPARKGGTAWAATQTVLTGGTNLINGTDGFRVDTAIANSGLSKPPAVGDINHDGYADIIMGTASSSGGYVYVLFGGPTRKDGVAWASSEIVLTGPGNLINGTNGFRVNSVAGTASECLGNAVATGDVNGDGSPDMILGNYCLHGAYVLYGKPSNYVWPSTFSESTIR